MGDGSFECFETYLWDSEGREQIVSVELCPRVVLTGVPVPYRVSRKSPLTIAKEWKVRVDMSFLDGVKAIVGDSHFLVPLFVLIAGIALLVVLH
jgi:hypothetical protein